MKILVGYRGTNVGQDLLKLAHRYAEAFSGEVVFITSLTGGNKTREKELTQVKQNLEEAKAFFDVKNIKCNVKLLVKGNTAGEDIVQYAKEKVVDHIIIGVKSRSKVGKLIFGSTAQYVILKAHCPVTTVK